MFSLRESYPLEFPQIINIPITETEIICTVSSLKNKTSCGYDGLSNKILKLCGSQISKPLTYMCNKSLTSGICPDLLKYAIIKPCFKESDKSQINNRPISLLTGFCKIFELLIFHGVKHHLVSNNILVDEQYGFCDSVSTESAIFRLTETIFSAWNNKECVTGLFCDLTRAFDCVRHDLLLLKLEFYEVKDSILNLLKFYLHNKKQRVVLQFVNSPNLLLDWEIDALFLRDLFWACYCLTCILMIFHAS